MAAVLLYFLINSTNIIIGSSLVQENATLIKDVKQRKQSSQHSRPLTLTIATKQKKLHSFTPR